MTNTVMWKKVFYSLWVLKSVETITIRNLHVKNNIQCVSRISLYALNYILFVLHGSVSPVNYFQIYLWQLKAGNPSVALELHGWCIRGPMEATALALFTERSRQQIRLIVAGISGVWGCLIRATGTRTRARPQPLVLSHSLTPLNSPALTPQQWKW